MSFKKAQNIFYNVMDKVLLIEDGDIFTSDFLPVKSLSYRHSKNVWVLYNHLGRIGIVNTKKKTVRPDFGRPAYTNYRITCKLRLKTMTNSQGIIETPKSK